jgi:hypothetical protein
MPTTRTILTLLSMLHEGIDANSATRLFRNQPVLDWTLRRLSAARLMGPAAILCWDDQLPDVEPIAKRRGVEARSQGERANLPNLAAIAAARRWSDGWRSGPIGVSAFDSGFHGPAVRDAAERFDAGAVLLIDPAAGLVDPDLVAAVARRWWDKPELEFTFTPAAPGLGAMLLARPLIDRLAASNAHPGRLLAYFPDQLSREPTSGDSCAPAPTPAARSLHRFTLSSGRQVEKLTDATAEMNGQLLSSNAEALALRVNAVDSLDPLPREVVLELTTKRLSRPIFSPLAAGPIERCDLPYELATRLIDELAELDDSRLTLAGVGDPLLHPRLDDLIAYAAAHSVSVNVETDLLSVDPSILHPLATSKADVVSVHLPALSDATYEAVMGVASYRQALKNVQLLVSARAAEGRGTPLVIPLFAKCRQNLHEMEPWYDQWLRAVGSAAILGPTTFGGLISDVAAADMTPPRRVPCRRLGERLTVLSDGRFTTCEQDVLGRQSIGQLGRDTLATVWGAKLGIVRKCHGDGRWNAMPVCSACSEWHRP